MIAIIVASVVGAAFLFFVLATIACIVLRRRRREQKSHQSEEESAVQETVETDDTVDVPEEQTETRTTLAGKEDEIREEQPVKSHAVQRMNVPPPLEPSSSRRTVGRVGLFSRLQSFRRSATAAETPGKAKAA